MKKTENLELDAKKPITEPLTVKSAAAKKKHKATPAGDKPLVAPKAKKTKTENTDKQMVELKAPKASKKEKAPKKEKALKAPKEQKDQKAPKDDKMTKFLVSMKKSVRKSVKKEAADVGVSMNEFIVLAVEAKLVRNALDRGKAAI